MSENITDKIERLNTIAKKAISFYLPSYKNLEYVGHSDKLVFKVESLDGERYILSVFFPKDGVDYYKENISLYSKQHVQAETDLLIALSEKTDLGTSCPIKNLTGDYISFVDIDGYPNSITVTMSTFIDGQPMNDKAEDYSKQAYAAGIAAAKLHDFSCAFPDIVSLGFPEHGDEYVRSLLLKIELGIGAKTISKEQYGILCTGGEKIISCMKSLDGMTHTTKGIIHTDLRVANFIMVDGCAVPVDFSRSVYGYLLYDLGEMCMHMGGSETQRQILLGYKSIRNLSSFDLHCVQAFSVLFLMMVVAEFALQDIPWLKNTVNGLCETQIPGILDRGFFVPSVLELGESES